MFKKFSEEHPVTAAIVLFGCGYVMGSLLSTSTALRIALLEIARRNDLDL